MTKSIIKNDNIDLSSLTSAIKLISGDTIYAIYDDTGTKDEFILSGGAVGGSVKITGSSGDVFTLQQKIVGTWTDVVSSTDGVIQGLPITSRGKGLRLVITTNTSSSIKFELYA